MKTRLPAATKSAVLLLSILFAATPARTEAAKSDLRPRYAAVVPGLDYANVRVPARPLSIHIARLDRSSKDFDIITTLGKGRIQGLSTLSEQVASVPPTVGRPLVAVNGDFFVAESGPYQGDPVGLQILNGELVSAPADHSFWAEPDGQLHIGTVYSELDVIWPGGAKTPMGLNQAPAASGVTLFTPVFGTSTGTSNAVELVLEKIEGRPWMPLRANQIYAARIREIRMTGNTLLSPDIIVLSVTGKPKNELAAIKPGAVVQFSTSLTADLSRASAAIGGSMEVVKDGKERSAAPERTIGNYLIPRHPRTALGFDQHYFYLVVVDGRQRHLSAGMSVPELASFMKELGCTHALNLDGGGSATFWLNGKVVNSPSDKFERPLANALVVVHRAKPAF